MVSEEWSGAIMVDRSEEPQMKKPIGRGHSDLAPTSMSGGPSWVVTANLTGRPIGGRSDGFALDGRQRQTCPRGPGRGGRRSAAKAALRRQLQEVGHSHLDPAGPGFPPDPA